MPVHLGQGAGRLTPHGLLAPFPRRLLPREDRRPVQWTVPRGAQAGLGPLLHCLAVLGHPVSVPFAPQGPVPAGILPLGLVAATTLSPCVWLGLAADASVRVAGASASWP